MKFKDIREMIYSSCKVIVDKDIFDVSTHYDTKFDDMEVIGVRSINRMIDGYSTESIESYIEVLLKWNILSSL